MIERFCRIIAAMMQAGVPLPDAMQAAIESTNNTRLRATARPACASAMLEGEGMAGRSPRTGLFPPAAVQMMRVGEETGTLDDQLETAADYYGQGARVQAQASSRRCSSRP